MWGIYTKFDQNSTSQSINSVDLALFRRITRVSYDGDMTPMNLVMRDGDSMTVRAKVSLMSSSGIASQSFSLIVRLSESYF